jgi:uncharacterized protein YcbK (DUF882 family)
MTLTRAGACLGVAGLFLFSANEGLQNAVAEGDTRTLSFHHLHTNEDITITFKRNGRYDDAALQKLDWFMRDWRREQSTKMDPHLFDLLWEAYREVGASEAIQVVCGFRSPATNAMLRARSTGVAQFSQHTQGQAMDFYIPGVPLEKIRIVGLRLQRGGVGFYPTSGSPFVHLDTGTIRHWPRMTHDQLAAVFPNGRTVHVPSDGHPLPGYALALAEVERNGAVPSATSLEAAREAGVVTASNRPARGLLERIFGGRKDADERNEEPSEAQAQAEPQAPVRARTALAMASAPKPVSTERIVPMPAARPKPVTVTLAAAKTKPAEPPMVVAALPNSLFDNPGYWRGSVDTVRNSPAQPSPFQTASADPAAPLGTAPSLRPALAYATDAEPQAPARARPMGATAPRPPETAALMPAANDGRPSIKPPLTTAMSPVTGTVADPWLRATILTPSVTAFLTTTQLGAADPRSLQSLFVKPSNLVVMTFSADPNHGMAAERFNGAAVVFLATASFTQTASLR